MILCLVTDRRRLGGALGLPESDWVDALHRQIEAAAAAGIDYIQVREPDIEAGPLVELVRSLMRRRLRSDPDPRQRSAGRRTRRQSARRPPQRALDSPGRGAPYLAAGVSDRVLRPRNFKYRCTKVRGLSHCRDRAAYSIQTSGRLSGSGRAQQGSRGSGGAARARDRRIGSVRDSNAGFNRRFRAGGDRRLHSGGRRRRSGFCAKPCQGHAKGV